MFTSRKLACSFCGKTAAEVSKLAAGPRVFICDVCAADAHRIMSDPSIGGGPVPRQATPGIWGRIRAWVTRHLIARGSTHAPSSVASVRAI